MSWVRRGRCTSIPHRYEDPLWIYHRSLQPPNQQDVICYHNFKTNEKVLEYKMTDEKMKEILFANYYGEAETEAKKQAKGRYHRLPHPSYPLSLLSQNYEKPLGTP